MTRMRLNTQAVVTYAFAALVMAFYEVPLWLSLAVLVAVALHVASEIRAVEHSFDAAMDLAFGGYRDEDDPDGETFRGREAAGFHAERQAQARTLK